jgi:hypothetical protein
LILQTSAGFSVRGRITVDGAPPPAEWLPRLEVTATGASSAHSSSSAVAADGSFTIRGVAGLRMVRLSGLPASAALERVTAAGMDMTERRLSVDGDTNGVEIVVTATPSIVSGRVFDERGIAVAADVVVYSEDAAHWSSPRFLKSAESDPEQGFRIQGLQPGRYLAVAVSDLDHLDWANPAVLERLRADATAFPLARGGTRALTLVRK